MFVNMKASLNDNVNANRAGQDYCLMSSPLIQETWQHDEVLQRVIYPDSNTVDLNGATWSNLNQHNPTAWDTPNQFDRGTLPIGNLASPTTPFEFYDLSKVQVAPHVAIQSHGSCHGYQDSNPPWAYPSPPKQSTSSLTCEELTDSPAAEPPATFNAPPVFDTSEPAERTRKPREPKPQTQLNKLVRVPKKKGRKPIIRTEAEKRQVLVRQRERNRAAAARCRKKRRRETKDLEQEAISLQERTYELQNSYESLRKEIFALIEIVLEHQDCDYGLVKQFLEQRYSHLAQLGPIRCSVANLSSPVTLIGSEEDEEDDNDNDNDDGNEDSEEDAEGDDVDAEDV